MGASCAAMRVLVAGSAVGRSVRPAGSAAPSAERAARAGGAVGVGGGRADGLLLSSRTGGVRMGCAGVAAEDDNRMWVLE